MQLEITTQVPAFDFNLLEMGYYQKHIFSKYAPPLAKAAKTLREVFEVIQMNPHLDVELIAAVSPAGMGEQYTAHFASDMADASALVLATIQQAEDSTTTSLDTPYITKNMALDVISEFMAEHKAKKLVSANSEQSIEFVSLATKLRTWVIMLDDTACKIACTVDIDPEQPSLNLSVDFADPEGCISIAFYAK
jgi:hypothetical protein